MYLMSAFDPPLCALVFVFRVKGYKLVLLSVEFSSIGLSAVFEYVSHRRLQKTEAGIDYK